MTTTIVTWNIQWARGVDGRVDVARIVDDARRCADFDVLCVQEVASNFAALPGHDGVDQFAEIAARLPGYVSVDGAAVDLAGDGGTRRRFGNLLLSRLPLRHVWRHLLPWPADPTTKSLQRGAIEAIVDAPGGAFRIVTTHLEYYSALQRAAQVERLRELQRDAVARSRAAASMVTADGAFEPPPPVAPSLLVGDFNFRATSAEHARLVAPIDAETPRFVDAWSLVHPGVEQPPTVGVHDRKQWPGPPFACDFSFASADLAPRVRSVRVDARSAASDHQPLAVEID